MKNSLTRIHQLKHGKYSFWAKREDEACFTAPEYPSGSKVRQYANMIAANPGKPMIVGCSAHSAMQIYVAAAAKLNSAKGIIYTPARAQRTEATLYAKSLGVELHEERPAYLNVIQSRASARAKTLRKGYVRWEEAQAVQDTAEQIEAIPALTKRIIVPTGSGLTAAGVLAGLYLLGGYDIPVVAVAVSGLANAESIKELAALHIGKTLQDGRPLKKFKLAPLKIVRAASKYEQWEAAVLEDGTILDPYYSAKSLKYVRTNDLLWLPGLRPLSAMPLKCQEKIKELREALPSYQGAIL